MNTNFKKQLELAMTNFDNDPFTYVKGSKKCSSDNKDVVTCYKNRKSKDKDKPKRRGGRERVNLVGNKYGKLRVVEMIYKDGDKSKCKCICDCDNEIVTYAIYLTKNNKTSCGCVKKKSRPIKDLTGKKFERLTVVRRAPDKKTKYGKNNIMWECVCDCGNTVIVPRNSLTSGKRESCGCLQRERQLHDLTGQRFGRLTVVKRAPNKYSKNGSRTTMWECVCDCGNTTITGAPNLTTGGTRSCGCLRDEVVVTANLKDWAGVISDTGIEFIEPYGISKSRARTWLCKCGLCGNEFVEIPARIMNEHVKSCGCLSESYPERVINDLLTELGITFKREYTFPDCKDKARLRFDFAIFNCDEELEFLLEYDGYQHFNEHSFNDGETLKDRQRRDNIKDEYCKTNNVDLLRIPYTYSIEEVKGIVREKIKQVF